MRDEERAALGKIGEVLTDLRGRWTDPSRQRQEYVTAGEVAGVNASEQRQNPALLSKLEELEGERKRIHELFMDGRATGMDQIEALAAKVERLREDFGVLDV